ncbi:MAG: hypothetical protein ACRDOB_16230 [Streptosporangiaceae bacterium]
MTWLLLNIPLTVVFFALWVGIPVWLVLKHPDRKPAPAAAPAVKTVPALRYQEDDGYRRVA